jgi:hypothetical protein
MGVGHVVVVGQGQTEIAIRELRRQLCQQRLDLMNGDAGREAHSVPTHRYWPPSAPARVDSQGSSGSA